MVVNPLVLKNSAGILLFSVLLFFMFLFVPWRRIKEFLGIGIIGGFGVGVLLVFFMQNLFGFWRFHQVDFFTLMGIPIFISAAWAPLEIIFCHLVSQYKNLLMVLTLIITLPLGAILVHYFLIINEMLSYNHWNLLLTFLVSLGIHLVIGYYLYITGRLGNLTYPLKTRWNPLDGLSSLVILPVGGLWSRNAKTLVLKNLLFFFIAVISYN